MLDLKFFLRVGPDARDRYRKHILKMLKMFLVSHLKAIPKNMVKEKKQTNLKDRHHNMQVAMHLY